MDKAGADGIGAYPFQAEIDGGLLGEHDETGLGGAICSAFGYAPDAAHGGDVDDGAPARFDHLRNNVVHGKEGTGEIDIDELPPLFGRHGDRRAPVVHGPAIDEYVKAAA